MENIEQQEQQQQQEKQQEYEEQDIRPKQVRDFSFDLFEWGQLHCI